MIFTKCVNCGESIRSTAVRRDGEIVLIWDHHHNGHHTVCNWVEDMNPTDIVATPLWSGHVDSWAGR